MLHPGNVAPRHFLSTDPTPVDRHALLERLDDLMEQESSLETVLVSIAELLSCPVGVRLPHGDHVSATPGERLDTTPRPADAQHYRLPNGLEVWALSPALDAPTLRRFALVCRHAGHPRKPSVSSVQSQLRALVDPHTDPATRSRALLYLRLSATSTVTVIVLVGPEPDLQVVIDQVRRQSAVVHTAPVDGICLCLAHGRLRIDELDVPVGVKSAASSPYRAEDAADAWREARLALRFALPSNHGRAPYATGEAVLVRGHHLGGYALLADKLDPDDITTVPDVARLDALCAEDDDEMLRTLEAVASTDSLRKAAQSVHMHHNSVARRVERAEQILGFGFTEPYGRTRLFLALTLRRIRGSRDLGRA